MAEGSVVGDLLPDLKGNHYRIRFRTTKGRLGQDVRTLEGAMENFRLHERCRWLPGRHVLLGGFVQDIDTGERMAEFGDPPPPDDVPFDGPEIRYQSFLWGVGSKKIEKGRACVRCHERRLKGAIFAIYPEGIVCLTCDSETRREIGIPGPGDNRP